MSEAIQALGAILLHVVSALFVAARAIYEMSDAIVKIEFLEMIAKQVREDLERDALRTIRQRNTEKGAAILNQIEGIERFMDAVHQACGHSFYRQAGLVKDAEQVPVLRAHARVEVLKKKKA